MNAPPMPPQNIYCVQPSHHLCGNCMVPLALYVSKLVITRQHKDGEVVATYYNRLYVLFCEVCGAEPMNWTFPEPLQN